MKRLLFSVLMLMGFATVQVLAAPKANSMDTDGDGKVSKQEFCAGAAEKAEAAGKEFKQANAEKQFAAKDKDGDGFLTGDELKAKAPKKEKEEEDDDDDESNEE